MTYASRFTILYDQDDASELASDCNCACPQVLPVGKQPLLALDVPLRVHSQLTTIALSPDHQVAVIPSLSRVAVLNRAAVELLTRFRTPSALNLLDDSEIEAARHLHAVGLLAQADRQAEPPPRPDELIAWFHVTNACNLRCTYCYLNKNGEAMTESTAMAAVDSVVRSAQRYGYQKLMLKYAGGEASLNMSLVDSMHAYAVKQAADANIALRGVVLSNGVGLPRRKLQRIRDLGLRLMISLDGPEQIHNAQRPTIHGQGSFKGVIQGVERARALGLDLTISITITGKSIEGLPTIVAWLLERNLHFSINFYRENDCSASFADLQLDERRLIDGMRAAYAEIERQLPRYSLLNCLLDRANLGAAHQRTCAVGENYLVIDQHGNIAKCQMEIERTVTSVWHHDPLGMIRLDPVGVQNVPVDQKTGCRDCEWRYWCAGGCAIATFRATGRYDVRSPNCAIYKALYPDVLRLEGLRLLRWAGLG